MKKKTIAYILIGVAALVIAYYVFFRKTGASALGAGTTDTRGVYASDDDAVYNTMRETFKAKSGDTGALGWVDDLVTAKYNAGGSTIHKLKGGISKAGTFLSVFEEANPNPSGKYLNGATKQLWPETLHTELWNMFNDLDIKYGAL